MNNIKLKKGDEVIVLAGKDKGKIGKIILVKKQVNKAVVAGINKVKKHQKPDNNQAGGIIEKEMPKAYRNLSTSILSIFRKYSIANDGSIFVFLIFFYLFHHF